MIRHHLCLLFALFLLGATSVASAKDVYFRHFSTNRVLGEGCILSIVQDEDGFMWFGTHSGLVRYDGSETRVFDHQHYPSLPGNVVTHIERVGKRQLWVQTREGIVVFDIYNETFTAIEEYIRLKAGAAACKGLGKIHNLHTGDDGHVMFNCGDWLCTFDPERGSLSRVDIRMESCPQKLSYSWLRDKHGETWLGYANTGVFHLDKFNDSLTLLGENAHTILAMMDYTADSILLGTLNRGVFVMSKRSGTSRKVDIPDRADGNIFVNAMCRVADNEVWIGTQQGVYVLRDGRIVQHLRHSEEDEYSLSQDEVNCIVMDREGMIWIGTEHEGVNCCLPSSNRMRYIYPCQRFPAFEGEHVTDFAEDSDGSLWVSTYDNGLNRIKPDGDITHFDTRTPTALSHNQVTALQMWGDELWIGSFSGGIDVLNTRTMALRNYKKTPVEGTLKNNEVTEFHVTAEGRMWVGTTTDVFLFDDNTETFKRLPQFEGYVTKICEDDKGYVWIGTRANGLYCYNKRTLAMHRYHHGEADGICRGEITDLTYDSRLQRLWIGTEESGVCVMDVVKRSFKHINTGNGLTSNTVCSITNDGHGAAWVATSDGVAKIDLQSSEVVQVLHGFLPDMFRRFSHGARLVSSCGEVILGSSRGAVAFFPNDVTKTLDFNAPFVTGISLSGDRAERSFVSLVATDSVSMMYDEAPFTIHFTALDYTSENSGEFEYMLEGFDNKWISCDGATGARYSHIAPGTYTFLLRYSVDGTRVFDAERRLVVTVLPPWWLTTWAKALWMICVIGIVALVWLWMLRRKQREMRIKQVTWQQQLREDELRMRTEFITNVAHELRTPVSVIRASLEQLGRKGDRTMSVERMQRNVERLSNLVDDLLELRRLEQKEVALEMRPCCLSKMLHDIIDSYEAALQEKGLKVKWPTATTDVWVMANEKALTSVLHNILGNALKYGGSLVAIDWDTTGEGTVLRVSNDGKTISPDLLPHIFDPFVKGNEGDGSTGLGLAMTRAQVAKMGGNIVCHSESDETCFVLSLQSSEPIRPQHKDEGVTTDSIPTPLTTIVENDRTRVMVVEDNADMRELLTQRLEEAFEVVSVADGQAAWDMLQDVEVDLIISDIMMPCMNGIDLCRNVKTNLITCHIPVILLTAKATEEDHIEGLQTGADAYVCKPFSTAQLMAQIKSLLHNRQLVRKRMTSMLKDTNSNSLNDEGAVNTCTDFMNDLDKDFTDRLNAFIQEHLAESTLNVDVIAEYMNMSRSNLHRKLKAIFDMTPGDYIHTLRLQRAAQMLGTGRYRVGEVCLAVGFRSDSYFTRAFQKFYGVAPSQYRG